jgi:hypothetical protein
MTAKSSAQASDRIQPIREHIYTLPVVRELPAQPADPVGAQSLW